MANNKQALWNPSKQQIESANITRFMYEINDRFSTKIKDFAGLHDWSIQHTEDFWSELWSFADVIGDRGKKILQDKHKMPGAVWFSDSKLNFAENLLKFADKTPQKNAIVFWGEDKIKRSLSFADLKHQVASVAQYMRVKGIVEGDIVAGFMPNMPESVVAMLATASIGAIWTSCSPDFGVQGVLDRFGQVKPKMLITANAYFYNGKTHDCLHKVEEIVAELDSIQELLVVPYANDSMINGALSYPQLLAEYGNVKLEFKRISFNSPLYIMYSSGTTGVPKCIVHGVGGTLLQHLKEHLLHVDLKAGERIFYFTTCGWMMWNWLVSALATGATLMLYDGSPFYPDASCLLDYVEQEKINVFGTSAKYIDVLRNESIDFSVTHSLPALSRILSTGSVLVPESYDYVYENIKANVCLSSISGGTDIVSCFALGSSILPVYRGELQCKGLAMDVQVWGDSSQVPINVKGELVCVNPFPSMPLSFWNDPDNKKYHEAYFSKFENIWCHGDYVLETDNGGLVFYGRSDTVLNPGGVRIGTAEIYRQVEKLKEVQESIVIGQAWQGDVRVVLFVKLVDNLQLDQALTDKIRLQIRKNTTPRHVPEKVLQVADIPRTKSGKIVELAVKNVVEGEKVKNSESLANPEALEFYRNRESLKS